ncbi:DUF389 domain-containing protein [cf. Phormidesmis sp. LEGE 11477]|uniref:DUF389 domain-containing protein n=1 Tax=cf. Phormidesmis sp. LEGE 11477 TaxID=1828680 RepID=UPI00187F03D3|nr:DUF389 domain-containing protein [cf. Phormidesmis sp. LEGE 11477]MBE9063710.1 DUF389 domain-containing protein [cf. Phormidesmis sp. LEGE 11477]
MGFHLQSDIEQRIITLSEFSIAYIMLMATAGVLSAVALLTNSVPVLIGSMVIAPAFPPLALVSFGLVHHRLNLAKDGAISAGLGLGIAISAALITAWLLTVTHILPREADLLNRQLLQERVSPGWYSVVTAIAAGVAGMIAMVEKKTDTLVGVVAALALVPAGVAGAIAFLSQDPIRGWGGMALLSINVGLIVLSGIVTLLFFEPSKAAENEKKLEYQNGANKSRL